MRDFFGGIGSVPIHGNKYIPGRFGKPFEVGVPISLLGFPKDPGAKAFPDVSRQIGRVIVHDDDLIYQIRDFFQHMGQAFLFVVTGNDE